VSKQLSAVAVTGNSNLQTLATLHSNNSDDDNDDDDGDGDDGC